MKHIQINLGQTIVIDDDDFERVSHHRWFTWFDKRKQKYVCPLTQIKDKHTVLSRFLLNAPKGLQVDHINKNVLDNRKINLRLCNNSINGHNRSIFKKNKTGFQGVYYDKYHKKYRAETRINGKKCFLGYFNSSKEASEVYEEKVKIYIEKYG
mgnify:CR=1 FL=1